MNVLAKIGEIRREFALSRIEKAKANLTIAQDIAEQRRELAKQQAEVDKINQETRQLRGNPIKDKLKSIVDAAKEQGYFNGKARGPFAPPEKVEEEKKIKPVFLDWGDKKNANT